MKRVSLKRFAAVHSLAAAVIVIYALLPIGCPINCFLHFECPACGSTRAIFSLLKGDISGYFNYNPMALPLLFTVLFGLHKHLFGLSARTERLIITPCAVAVFAAYILRLFL